MELVSLWWQAQQAQESAQEQKNTEVDWKKSTYPICCPLVRITSDDFKEPEQYFFLSVISKVSLLVFLRHNFILFRTFSGSYLPVPRRPC